MVELNKLLQIQERLKQNLDKSLQTNAVKPFEDLEKKLKQKIEESRRQESVRSDIIFTEQEIQHISQLFDDSSSTPSKGKDEIKSSDNQKYDIVFQLESGRCEIVSDLFPQPFYIVNKIEDAQDLKGSVWTLKEFIKFLELTCAVNGKVHWDNK